MKWGYQKRQQFEECVVPEEFRVEVADWRAALKDGLTALGLKAALVIAQQMLVAVAAQVDGAKERHQPTSRRRALQHGHRGGYVVLAKLSVSVWPHTRDAGSRL